MSQPPGTFDPGAGSIGILTPAASAAAGTGTASVTAIAIQELCTTHGLSCLVVDVAPAGRIPADAIASLKHCGLVIDARTGHADLQAQALRDVETALPSTAVLTTIALHRCIGPLARTLARPGNFAGMVFSMAQRRSLVEIVRGPATSDDTVALVLDFVSRLGKQAIVVGDAPGFYSARVQGSYLNEGMALVGEGVQAQSVEMAAVEAGMQAGPLAVLDELSLKRSDELLHQELHDLEQAAQSQDHGEVREHGHGHDEVHVHGHDHDHDHDHSHPHDHNHARDAHAHDAQPPGATSKPHKHVHKAKSKRMPEPAVHVMEKMAHGFRRMGREAGAGFYDYQDDGTMTLWSGLKAFERRSVRIPKEDIEDRLLFIQALETIRCLEEGVVSSVADADTGSMLGWGFPASTGGSAQFIDRIGVKAFVERAQTLADRYGDRFSPPAGLIDLAARNQPLDGQYIRATRGG